MHAGRILRLLLVLAAVTLGLSPAGAHQGWTAPHCRASAASSVIDGQVAASPHRHEATTRAERPLGSASALIDHVCVCAMVATIAAAGAQDGPAVPAAHPLVVHTDTAAGRALRPELPPPRRLV